MCTNLVALLACTLAAQISLTHGFALERLKREELLPVQPDRFSKDLESFFQQEKRLLRGVEELLLMKSLRNGVQFKPHLKRVFCNPFGGCSNSVSADAAEGLSTRSLGKTKRVFCNGFGGCSNGKRSELDE